jgi:hypothetical protein
MDHGHLACVLLAGAASLVFCVKLYGDLPDRGPQVFAPIYETEISFVTSVLEGCNKRHAFLFKDPLVAGESFHGYALPLLYAAALMSLGASYTVASVVIAFLNTMATAAAVYAFAGRFAKAPIVTTLLFIFSGDGPRTSTSRRPPAWKSRTTSSTSCARRA